MHDSKQEDVDYYRGTLERCEPDLHKIDTGAGWASVAVSLKRIADSMEQVDRTLQLLYELETHRRRQ